MPYENKIKTLKSIISTGLNDIIGDNCILVDAPYYDNIGDVLIWQGIEDFLSAHNKKLMSVSSGSTFAYPNLSNKVTILLMGGGNFGDLWRWFQEIRLKVISHYPDNRIIMFPQSIWYDNQELIAEDAKKMAQHKNLYLCARDKFSYDFLKNNFSANNILLIPDMAFYISDCRLKQFRNKETGKHLFFRRLDKEISLITPTSIGEDIDIHDWPTIEHYPKRFFFFNKACGAAGKISHPKCIRNSIYLSIDLLAKHYIKDSLTNAGCKFLAPYSKVTTTRLHAMILAILLHKPIEYIDNTTKKLSAFAETWLSNIPQVKSYEPD